MHCVVDDVLFPNLCLPYRRLDPHLQAMILCNLVYVRDSDVIHLEPAVHSSVVESEFFRDGLPCDSIAAHRDPEKSQALHPVLPDQVLDIHDDRL